MRRCLLRAVLAVAVGLTAAVPLAGPATGASTSTSSVARAEAAAVPGSKDPLAVAAGQALASLVAQDVPAYIAAQRQVAALAAARAKTATAAQLEAAWSTAGSRRLIALYAALAQVGVPYRKFASAAGKGFDCSGLTTYAWAVAGRSLPRSSGLQALRLKAVVRAQAGVADVIWYPGHVSLYLGAGQAMVHSPQPGKVVEVRDARRWVKTVAAPD